MRFVDIRQHAEAAGLTWQLLEERPSEASISHAGMPSRDAHLAFIDNHPYRFWYVIESDVVREPAPHRHPVGTISATNANELGIAILRSWQRQGYAARAIAWVLENLPPLVAIPGQRRGTWLANIAPGNMASQALFGKLGFELTQHTYQLPERGAANGEEKTPEG